MGDNYVNVRKTAVRKPVSMCRSFPALNLSNSHIETCITSSLDGNRMMLALCRQDTMTRIQKFKISMSISGHSRDESKKCLYCNLPVIQSASSYGVH